MLICLRHTWKSFRDTIHRTRHQLVGLVTMNKHTAVIFFVRFCCFFSHSGELHAFLSCRRCGFNRSDVETATTLLESRTESLRVPHQEIIIHSVYCLAESPEAARIQILHYLSAVTQLRRWSRLQGREI